MKISTNHTKLWQEITQKTGWFSVPDLTTATECNPAVVQRYLKFLVSLNLLERLGTHPAPLYKRNSSDTPLEAEAYIKTISETINRSDAGSQNRFVAFQDD